MILCLNNWSLTQKTLNLKAGSLDSKLILAYKIREELMRAIAYANDTIVSDTDFLRRRLEDDLKS